MVFWVGATRAQAVCAITRVEFHHIMFSSADLKDFLSPLDQCPLVVLSKDACFRDSYRQQNKIKEEPKP